MWKAFVYWFVIFGVCSFVGWEIRRFYESFEKNPTMANIFEDIIKLEQHFQKMATMHARRSSDKVGSIEGGAKDRAISNAYKYAATKVNSLVKQYNIDHPDTFFSQEFLASATDWSWTERFMLLFQPEHQASESGDYSEIVITYKKYNGKVFVINTQITMKGDQP